MSNFIVGTFEFSKVLITFFIMVYAYYFLRRSDKYIERKPWEYLYISSIFLFIVQTLGALMIYRVESYDFEIFIIAKQLIEYLFLGFLLLSFVYQHHLLLKRRVLIINNVPVTTWYDRVKGLVLEFEHRHMRRLTEENEDDPDLDKLLSEMRDARMADELVEAEAKHGVSQSEVEILVDRAATLLRNATRLLDEHKGHIPRDKEKVMRHELEELDHELHKSPVNADHIKGLIREITR